jgi:hypothetical protein
MSFGVAGRQASDSGRTIFIAAESQTIHQSATHHEFESVLTLIADKRSALPSDLYFSPYQTDGL